MSYQLMREQEVENEHFKAKKNIAYNISNTTTYSLIWAEKSALSEVDANVSGQVRMMKSTQLEAI
jgi:hypothetical protein